MKNIQHTKIVSSLLSLNEYLQNEGIPAHICVEAIRLNSWFTEYYIQESLKGILSWLNENELNSFLSAYEISESSSPKRIGIIAAGNVPFVCMHDILMVILSGNIAEIKLSHQDAILPKWFCETWIRFLPQLSDFLHFVPNIKEVDFLIATGSNNTANALDYQFSHIPKLVRRHRFSIGILKNDINEENLTYLCEDILLYNGLGCRNVSHLFVPKSFSLKKLIKALNEYPNSLLSHNYLQKLNESNARLKMLEEDFLFSNNAILQIQTSLTFSQLGIINVVLYEKETEIMEILMPIENQIQCIVGLNISFGQAQKPFLADFADNEDTMALLLKLKQ